MIEIDNCHLGNASSDRTPLQADPSQGFYWLCCLQGPKHSLLSLTHSHPSVGEFQGTGGLEKKKKMQPDTTQGLKPGLIREERRVHLSADLMVSLRVQMV